MVYELIYKLGYIPVIMIKIIRPETNIIRFRLVQKSAALTENPVNELSRGLKNHKNMNIRTMERNINIVVSNWNCIINWALEAP
jgi:hypothetical protein